MLLFVLLIVSLLCPFLVFLDYHKRSDIRKAVIYVAVFYPVVLISLPLLALNYGLTFAATLPFAVGIIALAGRALYKRNR